jgi:hypothetical protein
MAKRVQRSRAKGWRKADGDVYVGRPTKWGNPYRTKPRPSAEAVDRYRSDLLAGRLPFTVDDVRRELRGKDLLCWCELDHPCHADMLLEVANRS